MIEIKSIDDAKRVPQPWRSTMVAFQKLLEGFGGTPFDAERYGYMVFMEATDNFSNVPHLYDKGSGLLDLDASHAESITRFVAEQLYEVIIVINNEFTMSYWIPQYVFETILLPANSPLNIELCYDASSRLDP